MKRNKIFNWLYFIILLIPIMFVFLPMINNETIYKTEKKQNVQVVEYGSLEYNILPFLIDISYNNLDNEIYFVSFNDLYNYLVYYGYTFNEDNFALLTVNDNDEYNYILGELGVRTYNDINYYGIINNDADGVVGNLFSLVNDDDDDLYEAFSFNINYSGSSLMFAFDSVVVMSNHVYLFYYKDYVITEEIINTSIWYDFSVKINDSVPIMGNFTEWVNDNIVDFSSNDYVFFAWTYMIYIFIVSLLWLLIQFILFLVRFAERWLNGIYEKF